MRTKAVLVVVAMGVASMLGVFGCSDVAGPREQASTAGTSNAVSVVSQDLAQLGVAGVTEEATKGVFSIGWKKFVGPDITQQGTIGEAYAVVWPETSSANIRPAGLDIGTVTLSYDGGSVELTKRTMRDGSVLYETFSRGMRLDQGPFVNIPFVANSTYQFTVSGSGSFPAGTFDVIAPPSLLTFVGHADRDTILRSADLSVQWQGGSATDSVLLRIVPHLRPPQVAERGMRGGFDSLSHHGGKGGPNCHRKGQFAMGGPLQGLGPEFGRGIVVKVPNSGSYIVSASDLQELLGGTQASEIMVGVTQVVRKSVSQASGALSVLLRNGDRIVLYAK
ncbi:MAG: hypothetical protein H6Q30_1834 [Bacteroidetes bacterium]|jgi:hypothetical protein|nr:hypothetical protein [Bacteroidota bacterium]